MAFTCDCIGPNVDRIRLAFDLIISRVGFGMLIFRPSFPSMSHSGLYFFTFVFWSFFFLSFGTSVYDLHSHLP
jgi:hypothetical protein